MPGEPRPSSGRDRARCAGAHGKALERARRGLEEPVVQTGGLPWTIVRGTQTHDFPGGLLASARTCTTFAEWLAAHAD
jgi:hypothetical protein